MLYPKNPDDNFELTCPGLLLAIKEFKTRHPSYSALIYYSTQTLSVNIIACSTIEATKKAKQFNLTAATERNTIIQIIQKLLKYAGTRKEFSLSSDLEK